MTTDSQAVPRPQTRRLPALARAAMRFQAFLLRRNWMGALGDEIMVITVTGRASGRRYSTPIGFLPDPEVRTPAGQPTLIALTGGGGQPSQWYRNVLAHPEVTLEIRGRALAARGQPVDDPAERERLFGLYQRERRARFPQLFGLPADSPAEALAQALASRRFIRFHPLAD